MVQGCFSPKGLSCSYHRTMYTLESVSEEMCVRGKDVCRRSRLSEEKSFVRGEVLSEEKLYGEIDVRGVRC